MRCMSAARSAYKPIEQAARSIKKPVVHASGPFCYPSQQLVSDQSHSDRRITSGISPKAEIAGRVLFFGV